MGSEMCIRDRVVIFDLYVGSIFTPDSPLVFLPLMELGHPDNGVKYKAMECYPNNSH